MTQNIAYCGLNCAECGAYLATINNDDRQRAEVAEQWSREYHVEMKPADINCTGCLSTSGTVFSHCQVCEVRLCGLAKNVANCAHCKDFICDKLEKFFQMAPFLRDRLQQMRADLNSASSRPRSF